MGNLHSRDRRQEGAQPGGRTYPPAVQQVGPPTCQVCAALELSWTSTELQWPHRPGRSKLHNSPHLSTGCAPWCAARLSAGVQANPQNPYMQNGQFYGNWRPTYSSRMNPNAVRPPAVPQLAAGQPLAGTEPISSASAEGMQPSSSRPVLAVALECFWWISWPQCG